MNIWGILRLVKLRDVRSLFKLLLRFPLFAYPTISATLKCIRLSNKYFGKEHYKNNAANAFRHALWNYLIILRCKAWTKEVNKAIQWAELITNWHENFSPNKDLARAMDLHNNQVGRNLFRFHNDRSIEEGITRLMELVPQSTKISNLEDLKNYTDRLVHITE
ncbi:hypothetical protein OO009_02130 [Flavobacteriaceae bacterium KMM 6897]|nr:hypothetical protein [Flavobacteriaceae bacterium KMM 6897]